MAIWSRKTGTPPADPAAMKRIGQRLIGEWEDLRNRRYELDVAMIENHLQYRAKYSPEQMAAIKEIREEACQLYIGLTRTKVRTLDARINEMAFGVAKNWSVEPTPKPDLAPDALAELQSMLSNPEFARLSQEEQVRRVARLRAERMDQQMEDYLVEADYYRLFRRVTHLGHKQAAGILKGPLVTRQMRRAWGYTMSSGKDGATLGEWRMQGQPQVRPFFEVCSTWDMYLDWNARTPKDSDWYFQRHLFRRTRAAMLAAHAIFFPDAIRTWLERAPDGDAQWENFENLLFQSSGKQGSQPAQRQRWEAIEGWGVLSAEELLQLGMEPRLKAAGVKLDEVSAALLEAHTWQKRDGEIIGLSLNPNEDQSRPYSFYLPTPDDDSVYGTAWPETVRPIEKGFTGAWRMTFDNAATSVGPQIEVRSGRLLTQGDLGRMTPYRIWPTREEPWNSANPAIQFSDFPNHVAVFLALINALQVMYDEVGGVPRYQHGAGSGGGVGRTASGLAMLMGAAGQLVKDQLRAWDEFQSDVLTKLFNWTMQFSPRPEIKGDHRVKIRTSTSILQKAEHAQEIRQFRLSTANALDAKFTKRREMLEEEAKALDLDPALVVKSPEDLKAELEDMKNQPPPPGQEIAQRIALLDAAAGIVQKLGNAAANNSKAGGDPGAAMEAEMAALLQIIAQLRGDAPAQPQPQIAQGVPGPAPEGPSGQPPAPAPGPAAGTPVALPPGATAADGGLVHETLGDVVGRMHPDHFGPAPRMARRGGAVPHDVASSVEEDIAGVQRDYEHLLGGPVN